MLNHVQSGSNVDYISVRTRSSTEKYDRTLNLNSESVNGVLSSEEAVSRIYSISNIDVNEMKSARVATAEEKIHTVLILSSTFSAMIASKKQSLLEPKEA